MGYPRCGAEMLVGLNLNATNPDDLKGMSSCQWFRVDGERSDEVTKLPTTLAEAQIARLAEQVSVRLHGPTWGRGSEHAVDCGQFGYVPL